MDVQIGCCYWFLSRGEGRAVDSDCCVVLPSVGGCELSGACVLSESVEFSEENADKSSEKDCDDSSKSNAKTTNATPTISSLIHAALTETPTHPLHLPFFPYTLQSKVVITGIGADELCGGYTRHQAAYNQGGYEASWQECKTDWDRLWYRNLVREKEGNEAQGRDDRCVSEHGREMRAPFLDESVNSFIRGQPIDVVREGESCDGADHGLFPASRRRR